MTSSEVTYSNSPPKLESIPLDPDVVALLKKILDINESIVRVLCTPKFLITREKEELDG